MGIPDVEQPNDINIDDTLRLVKFDGNYDNNFEMALNGHQDLETVWLLDGDEVPYTLELLEKMYTWLNENGELYFIETYKGDKYEAIGDVTFSQKDMPIIIWDKTHRNKGIATKVIKKLIERARELGYEKLEVEEIFNWNEASMKSFMNNGFKPFKKTETGQSYKLRL